MSNLTDPATGDWVGSRLRVRDSLLLALSFSTGVWEAICFLSFGKVFTGFQTGNLVFLGLGAAGTRPPAGPNPVSVIVSLAAFAVGAALAMPMLRARGTEAEVGGAQALWPVRVTVTLATGLLLQVGFFAGWAATSPSQGMTYLLLALNAWALGMQMNAIRSLHIPGTSTTAFTAALVSIVSGTATRSITEVSARRLAGTMLSLALGALLGDWMLGHAHIYAPLVPVLVMLAVLVVGAIALRPGPVREASQPAGGRYAAPRPVPASR